MAQQGFPYRHGGSPRNDFSRLNVSEVPVVDFSVSLNLLGPPALIRRRWGECLDTIESYPSVEGDGTRYYYQKKLGISPENFLAGNGSTEMIYLVPRAFQFKRVLVVTPSYNDYERASLLAGAKAVRYPLLAENGFSSIDADRLVKDLKHADALWLGRPNNPTGTVFPKELILEFGASFPEKWFIIDESFIQFMDGWERESLIPEQDMANVLTIHSLTKFYAIAGLRMGGIAGNAEAISRLRALKEPWTVNGIADRIAPFLLECGEYEDRTISENNKERERIFRGLEGIRGIKPFPSSTNFILCQWTRTHNLDDLLHHLLLNGIYVRDCRNFPGLEKNYFRVGLRTAADNEKLLDAISAFEDNLVSG